MDWHLFITIMAAIIAVVSAVAWVGLWSKGKKLWANLLKLKGDYQAAMADGQITDEEKRAIADTLIAVIEDGADIWQAMTNLALQIIAIIRRARSVNPSSRVKPK